MDGLSEDVVAETIPYGLGRIVYGDAEPEQQLTLNAAEVRIAETHALDRHNRSRASGLEDTKHVYDRQPDHDYKLAINIDRIGAAAEMAYCKFMKFYWEPRIDNFKEADVGEVIQIRGAASRERGNISLIVRKDDNPQHYYVLVEVELDSDLDEKRCWVRGWIYGEDAMRNEWWGNKGKGKPCWWVPQEALIPFYVSKD